MVLLFLTHRHTRKMRISRKQRGSQVPEDPQSLWLYQVLQEPPEVLQVPRVPTSGSASWRRRRVWVHLCPPTRSADGIKTERFHLVTMEMTSSAKSHDKLFNTWGAELAVEMGRGGGVWEADNEGAGLFGERVSDGFWGGVAKEGASGGCWLAAAATCGSSSLSSSSSSTGRTPIIRHETSCSVIGQSGWYLRLMKSTSASALLWCSKSTPKCSMFSYPGWTLSRWDVSVDCSSLTGNKQNLC